MKRYLLKAVAVSPKVPPVNAGGSPLRLPPSVRWKLALFFVLCLGVLSSSAVEAAGIIDTLHNLSSSGPAERQVMSFTETRICIFCHTPHNATPRTPLWNRSLEATSYEPYRSTTLAARPGQPTGPSRLCLSCHDGTVALGAVLNPQGGLQLNVERLAPGMPSYIGTDLSNSHPISFSYDDSVSNPLAGLDPMPPEGLVFYGGADVQCPTCHDAHADEFRSPDLLSRLTGKFLVMENRYADLCVICHNRINGWNGSGHKNSVASVTGVLPLTTPEKIRNWPTWSSVTEWGCESCHTPHGAGGAERLLYYREEEKNCYLCHNGVVATDIRAQFQKASVHPVANTTIGLTPAFYHDPTEDLLLSQKRHVECVDCHNPHAANNTGNPPAPFASGMLAGVDGIRIDNTEATPVINEYEICFRCHGETAPPTPFLPRVIDITNTRLEFAAANQSYHPVAAIGKNIDPPPSLNPPSQDPEVPQNFTNNSLIFCTDCHSDEYEFSRGPHGSMFPPILRRRYETTMGTPSSFDNYSLCFRCHNEASIMSDASFKKTGATGGHSGHVQTRNTPCSVCHDPHGVSNNTNLINFDKRYVKGPADSDLPEPTFIDSGLFSGNCTLVCHYDPSDFNVKITHINASY